MRNLWLSWFLAVGALAPSVAGDKVTVGVFEYPPIYQDALEKGLACDLVEASFRAIHVEPEFRFYPAGRMVRAVAQGEVTCGVGGAVLFRSPDILENVRSPVLLQYVAQVFFYQTAKFPHGVTFQTLNDLKRYRIGVLQSSGIQRILEEGGLIPLASSSHEGIARQLQAGRVDLWATVDLTGNLVLSTLFPRQVDAFKSTAPFHRGDVSVFFSKAQDPYGTWTKRFQEGLAVIKKNGTYRSLMAHYYGGPRKVENLALADDVP